MLGLISSTVSSKLQWIQLYVLRISSRYLELACGYLGCLWCDCTHAAWQKLTVYPKKYTHGFCFAVLCCGYTLTDFPISIRLTSLALWQSNDCPSASKATLMNMDKYFMWIHYERLHNHNKAKHNKTLCIFLGIYCTYDWWSRWTWKKRISQKLLSSETNILLYRSPDFG